MIAEHHINNFIITQDKRAFVRANENLDNKRFYIDKDEFMFSKIETGIFEVRKLSNTFNSNVIFGLKLKPGFYGLTKHEMKQLLLSTPIDFSMLNAIIRVLITAIGLQHQTPLAKTCREHPQDGITHPNFAAYPKA